MSGNGGAYLGPDRNIQDVFCAYFSPFSVILHIGGETVVDAGRLVVVGVYS